MKTPDTASRPALKVYVSETERWGLKQKAAKERMTVNTLVRRALALPDEPKQAA